MIIFVLIWPAFQKHLGESILHTIPNQNYSKKSQSLILSDLIKSLKIDFWHEIQAIDFFWEKYLISTQCV